MDLFINDFKSNKPPDPNLQQDIFIMWKYEIV